MADRPQATPTLLLDEQAVRIPRWSFAPGAQTGWHRHEYDYVITPVTDCAFLLEEPGSGSRRADIAAGEAYRREAGVEHNVINAGDTPMMFIEVELKR